ncbi:PemK family protein [Aphanothece hegewaldii CCALA 016]|uniref:PemK family protein n=1 Tax=Aphanothece hegewaldii CCALA 016 TaxID=2107694 RepID=A0A2T1LW15_9CHRO|nr:type II toxin-antitoxin system PemK/MazF family toxin [Aphanothece hegewaldii]PSF36047.1 PemK family protein [Aphanothece hegewaldii CCALA 016]
MLKKGDIVLVPFSFTDLKTTKLRPSVVLWVDKGGNDITVCFITTQNLAQVSAEEFIIETSDAEFLQTGLKTASKVKVAKIVTIDRNLIIRKLGQLENELLQKLDDCLHITFQLKNC